MVFGGLKRNNEQTRTVVIDGQNIAFYQFTKDWNLVISAAFYYDKAFQLLYFYRRIFSTNLTMIIENTENIV